MVWSSYAHGTSDVPLLGETVGANLDRTVERLPDVEALVSRHQDVRLTYAQFGATVDLVARGLLAFGVAPGDRVGVWSPNNVEWVLVQYAVAKVGAVLVSVNTAYRHRELQYVLQQSGTRLLFAAESVKSPDYRDVIDGVLHDLDRLERVLHIGSGDWDDLLSAGEAVPMDALRARSAGVQFDDPVNIMFTSGTTGAPKGVTVSHHASVNNGDVLAERCGYSQHDRVCLPLPFHHGFGNVCGNIACTTHGACIVIPGPTFDPGDVLDAVQAERCTSLYGVPTMFLAELSHPAFDRYDLSSLRTGLMGGSPCPRELMDQVVSRMHIAQIAVGYGMTETMVTTLTSPDDAVERRVSTVGPALPHVELKIVDPNDRTTVVPRGVPGELCARGYSNMLGYWDDDAATNALMGRGRWLHTGDLAVMDDDGYLQIVGRIKDMIIRGGINVDPGEIENFLLTHPDIADVAVVGVPDPEYGEHVLACIRPVPGASVTQDDVRAYCDGRIAYFKVPYYIQFVDAFPMTVTGKIQKFKIRERAISELDLAV